MGQDSSAGRGDNGFIGCPRCTIQVPIGTTVCPHCRSTIHAREEAGPRGPAVLSSSRSPGARFWDRYGIWVKAGGPVLVALVVLLVVYRSWSGFRIQVVPNADLPLQVEKERRGNTVVLRGTVTNRGVDVPDLSLKSIRVVVDLLYRDGRREKRTAFPKTRFRGEGALLRGETGTFELVAPSDRLDTITFRCEIVDLDLGKTLIPARRRRVPARRR
ncbi:MAG: hypothetical protein Kow00128_03940 [Deltaproteobacteria bacterium]